MAKLSEVVADRASSLFLRSATVSGVRRVSDRFLEIDLEAESFVGASWVPGQKLQIRPAKGSFATRTYTPIRWDEVTGATRIVAFTHGDGPGARWCRSAQVGQECEVFGPRKSIDLTELSGPVVFAGDETSVGLALALGTVPRISPVRHLFESTAPDELTEVLRGTGLLETATVLTKSEGGFLAELRELVPASDPFDLVLTGDTATIAAVRRDVKTWARKPSTTKAKGYWAEGRTGLD